MSAENILSALNSLLLCDDIQSIRKEINSLHKHFYDNTRGEELSFVIPASNEITLIKKKYLLNELNQILETQSLERTKYYIRRLVKTISEKKTSKINELNLNRWKEYEDILTDSLWVLNKRDSSGAHNAGYWGNFIPQIPNQFLRRYTKKGDWVLDPFLGSGTTLIECKRLGRNGIGIDLSPKVVSLAERNIGKEKNPFDVRTEIFNADSASLDLISTCKKAGIKSVQFVFLHPPYWDIIKFSDDKNDLSNSRSIKSFLEMFGNVFDNALSVLQKGRYAAIVIGDKYSAGEWIPLAFETMNEALKRKVKLKSIIVKNFEDTTGKRAQKELWRYRALLGGFYIFKHEYIFLFQKK